ncbi:unnamed protein product [Vitrella brassicaformis CCMP3155]|uniref:Uncharacterized protein n=1 Tax=Vitrella brassicaformis (strain CCMP3155) TaxID=1169540 RepID=A0A0G4EGQ1_VITBC|nr:unnamed protein product [Vitrella brassicaformis CCMP3155]|eukprot:CEL94675.1 unnamed protein product [Vitrella brassicaformis CCMP3155]
MMSPNTWMLAWSERIERERQAATRKSTSLQRSASSSFVNVFNSTPSNLKMSAFEASLGHGKDAKARPPIYRPENSLRGPRSLLDLILEEKTATQPKAAEKATSTVECRLREGSRLKRAVAQGMMAKKRPPAPLPKLNLDDFHRGYESMSRPQTAHRALIAPRVQRPPSVNKADMSKASARTQRSDRSRQSVPASLSAELQQLVKEEVRKAIREVVTDRNKAKDA